MSHHNVYPQQQLPRTSPKTKSNLSNSLRWKENLRKECLVRAKIARRERFMGQRSNGGSTCHHAPSESARITDEDSRQNQGMKRHREGDHSNAANYCDEMGEHEHLWLSDCKLDNLCNDSTCAEKENPLHFEAKALVEQELQKSMMGLQYCHQILPLHDEGNASKRKLGVVGWNSTSELNAHDIFHDDDECKISREEYDELVNAVTEELEREHEMLAEELWEMERLEALERERLLHDIDDYESWEEEQMQQFEHSNQPPQLAPGYTSHFTNPSSPQIICPVCNSKSLVETSDEGIQCLNSINNTELSATRNCNFQLDIAHEGLTLHHLQSQLATLYEEHSGGCSKGVLHFRMEKRGGMMMLMAACEECCLDVIVL